MSGNPMEFKKAVKTKQWLRLAIDGISGSGKTMSALRIANGMAKKINGKIALIDSEHGSAALYADRFEFDTLELNSFQIEDYTGALDAAKKAGYEIVIIDSTSHAWDALLERVDRIGKQKFGGNTWAGWAEGTPLQKKLIEAMLTYPGHIIATCRSKTEYSVDRDDKGKTSIKKVGMAAVQRPGFEYEFTMAMTIDGNHTGMFTKDRTGKFQDKFFEKPDESIGEQLIVWLNEGAALPPYKPPVEELPHNGKAAGKDQEEIDALGKAIGGMLHTKDPEGCDYFTSGEIDIERELFKKGDIQSIRSQHDRIKKMLELRVADYKPIPWEDKKPEPENSEEKPELENNDDYEDDVPVWATDKKEEPEIF